MKQYYITTPEQIFELEAENVNEIVKVLVDNNITSFDVYELVGKFRPSKNVINVMESK